MQLDLVKTVRFAKEATVIGAQVIENPHKCRIRLVIENCRCSAIWQAPAGKGLP